MAEILRGEIKDNAISVWRAEVDSLSPEVVTNSFKGGNIDFRPYPSIEIRDEGIVNGRRLIWVGGIHLGVLSLIFGLDKSHNILDEEGSGIKIPYPKVDDKNLTPGSRVDPNISPNLIMSSSQKESIINIIQQQTK